MLRTLLLIALTEVSAHGRGYAARANGGLGEHHKILASQYFVMLPQIPSFFAAYGGDLTEVRNINKITL